MDLLLRTAAARLPPDVREDCQSGRLLCGGIWLLVLLAQASWQIFPPAILPSALTSVATRRWSDRRASASGAISEGRQ